MQPQTLFSIINFGILGPWALLIFAPHWRGTQRLLSTASIFVALGILYTLIMLLAPMPPGGTTLEAIAAVLGSPWGATVAWVHMVTFDLFVGSWITRDAPRQGLRHLWVVPCLLLTLFFGPAGLMIYLGVRAVTRRTVALESPQGVG